MLMFKTKTYFSTFIKLIISLGAIYFFINNLDKFRISTNMFRRISIFWLFVIILLSTTNWIIEIKKWQYLASKVSKISFKNASKQSLISFSISLLTPNRIGELGAKALFFDNNQAKNIFSLSLIGTTTQMISSLIYGFLGVLGMLVFFSDRVAALLAHLQAFSQYNYVLIILIIAFVLLAGIIIITIKTKKKLLLTDWKNWQIPLLLSMIRYLVFSSQFLLIYQILSQEKNVVTVYISIMIMYFIATLIPMLAFVDWAVKATIAFWIFDNMHLSSEIAVFTVGIMWLLNFAIPFLVGLIWMWQSRFRLLQTK